MPGKVRITSESWEKPLARICSPVIALTDEPLFCASIGTRLGETTSSSGSGIACPWARPDAAISAPAARPQRSRLSVVRWIDMTCPLEVNMSRRRGPALVGLFGE